MGQYSDSQIYAENIRILINERGNAYKQGVGYYNNGLYEKAIAELIAIAEYLDAGDYIETSAGVLYQQAMELYDREEYSGVKEKLTFIPTQCSVYAQGQQILLSMSCGMHINTSALTIQLLQEIININITLKTIFVPKWGMKLMKTS